MTNTMIDLELYNRTKSGVEYKLWKRRKNKKRVVIFGVLLGLFIGVNTTTYALSTEYRNWLSQKLGLPTDSTIRVEENIYNR